MSAANLLYPSMGLRQDKAAIGYLPGDSLVQASAGIVQWSTR